MFRFRLLLGSFLLCFLAMGANAVAQRPSPLDRGAIGSCDCPFDQNDDGVFDTVDTLILLAGLGDTTPFDLNENGLLNTSDLLIALSYVSPYNAAADVNCNGVVDGYDISIFVTVIY